MFPRPFSATTRTDFASRVSLLSCAQRTTTACPAIICSGARWRATGSAVPAERMDISAGSEQEKSQILNAAALLLELAEATGSEQLPHEIEAYLSIAIYKVYRYLYLAGPGSIEAVFRAPHDCFDYLCDARAREHELRIRTAARGEAGYGITAEELQRFPLSPAAISERFPSLSSDLLTVLQQVSDSIEALGKNFPPENKKS